MNTLATNEEHEPGTSMNRDQGERHTTYQIEFPSYSKKDKRTSNIIEPQMQWTIRQLHLVFIEGN
jgi:hypothetical protein